MLVAAVIAGGFSLRVDAAEPVLRKVGVIGEPVHFVLPLDHGLMCGITPNRLKVFKQTNVNEVISSYWTPYRGLRVLEAFQGHLYLSQGQAGVDICKIDEQGAVKYVSNLNVVLPSHGALVIRDATLFCLDGQSRSLVAYSLREPAKPVLQAAIKLTAYGTSFQIIKNMAYVLCHDRLLILDIADLGKGAPLCEIPIKTDISVGALIVKEPWAYAFVGHKIQVFNVSDPTKIAEATNGLNAAWCSHAVLRENRLITYGDNGIFEYAIDEHGGLGRMDEHHNYYPAYFMVGRTCDYMVAGGGQVRVRERGEKLSRRLDPLVVRGEDVIIREGLACVIGEGLKVYDVAQPETPRFLSALAVQPSYRSKILLRHGCLYTFRAVDLRNPASPAVCSEYTGGTGASIDGNTLYGVNENRLSIWSLRNPTAPELKRTHDLKEKVDKILVRRRTAYVAVDHKILRIYRVGRDYGLTPLSEITAIGDAP
jgi:hypothetical protein